MTPAKMAALHALSFARGWSEEEIAALLAKPTSCAVSNAHGFAILQIVAPEAELLTIVVAPEARNCGYGQSLLGHALLAAAQYGADTMFLEVDASNRAALALYAKAGFTRTGTRAAYYAHPDGTKTDAITMTHTAV